VHEHVPAVRKGDDLAAILYTSGTTGRSKGAMLTHANLLSNALTLKTYWGWRPSDVLIHALPIFHVHGLFVASHGALLVGARMLWLGRFDAAKVAALLPRDDLSGALHTVGAVLSVFPFFLEKYLSAARELSVQAIGNPGERMTGRV
jgi:acyl-CoA synthetase (AMP-forming)/AMP-acid ligase II